MELSLDSVDPAWARVLAPLAPNLAQLSSFLTREELEGRPYLPADDNILRAFTYPMDAVRVLIVGQDPYPTPGHPVGLSFALERHVTRLPGSLKNIYRELRDDLGVATPDHGDLTPWAESGVMLLNRVLTVRSGPRMAGSHSRAGWEAVTDAAIRALVARDAPLVAILWGNKAQSLAPLLGSTPIVASPHPSGLSASRGFFGSKPFSRANDALLHLKAEPVDWSLN